MWGQGIDCLISDHLARVAGEGGNAQKKGGARKKIVSRKCPNVHFV